ncbi:MAG TPA: hypothetical protein VGN64_03595, partial [Dyadobacter sp.]|nr:hypothetical protein [Dyadobacter sp.]
ESEDIIIKKYSRETEKEFTIFGIPTQISNNTTPLNLYREAVSEDINGEEGVEKSLGMKQAIMNIITTVTGVEKTFTGKMPHEYIIDPIAVYMDI